MNVIHFIVDRFYPQPGGLEVSALRVARALRNTPDSRVIVYIRSEDYTLPTDGSLDDLELQLLGARRKPATTPMADGLFNQLELRVAKNWLDFMQVRDAVAESLRELPQARHVVLSFNLISAGFVAQHVALALSLPHVASVRGSEYSSGIHEYHVLPALEFVARRADVIVTSNDEQRRFFTAAYGAGERVRTIHNSLPESILGMEWCHPTSNDGEIHLIADCGYSFKKGTHLLMGAFEQLATESRDLRLSIVGRIQDKTRTAFWTRLCKQLQEQFGDRVSLQSHIPPEEVISYLLRGHIYCSATLGEGCSNARIAALAVGMPIVTTRCGEMLDLAAEAPHVRLARPGDQEDFTRVLGEACEEFRRHTLQVERSRVEQWRRYFTPEREAHEWNVVIKDLLA
jgi:glycosyltransferase involved in cell wall biosynthesis